MASTLVDRPPHLSDSLTSLYRDSWIKGGHNGCPDCTIAGKCWIPEVEPNLCGIGWAAASGGDSWDRIACVAECGPVISRAPIEWLETVGTNGDAFRFLKTANVPYDGRQGNQWTYDKRRRGSVALARIPLLVRDGRDESHNRLLAFLDIWLCAMGRDGLPTLPKTIRRLRKAYQRLLDELRLDPADADSLEHYLTCPRVCGEHQEQDESQFALPKWANFRYTYVFSQTQLEAAKRRTDEPPQESMPCGPVPQDAANPPEMMPPTFKNLRAALDQAIVRLMPHLGEQGSPRDWFRCLLLLLCAPPKESCWETLRASLYRLQPSEGSVAERGVKPSQVCSLLESVSISEGPVARCARSGVSDYQPNVARDPTYIKVRESGGKPEEWSNIGRGDYSVVFRNAEEWLLPNVENCAMLAVPLLLPEDTRPFAVIVFLLKEESNSLAEIASSVDAKWDRVQSSLGHAYVDDVCDGFYEEALRQFRDVERSTGPQAVARVASKMRLWLDWYTSLQPTLISVSGSALSAGAEGISGVRQSAPDSVGALYETAPKLFESKSPDRAVSWTAKLGTEIEVKVAQLLPPSRSNKSACQVLVSRLADCFRDAWDAVRLAEAARFETLAGFSQLFTHFFVRRTNLISYLVNKIGELPRDKDKLYVAGRLSKYVSGAWALYDLLMKGELNPADQNSFQSKLARWLGNPTADSPWSKAPISRILAKSLELAEVMVASEQKKPLPQKLGENPAHQDAITYLNKHIKCKLPERPNAWDNLVLIGPQSPSREDNEDNYAQLLWCLIFQEVFEAALGHDGCELSVTVEEEPLKVEVEVKTLFRDPELVRDDYQTFCPQQEVQWNEWIDPPQPPPGAGRGRGRWLNHCLITSLPTCGQGENSMQIKHENANGQASITTRIRLFAPIVTRQ